MGEPGIESGRPATKTKTRKENAMGWFTKDYDQFDRQAAEYDRLTTQYNKLVKELRAERGRRNPNSNTIRNLENRISGIETRIPRGNQTKWWK
jgi:hypothetical protein